MARRSKAREVALQMLYQMDVNADTDPKSVRFQIAEEISEPDLCEFAWQVFAGVMECRADVDARLETVAENWSLSRMAITDRNALRIGAFEILHSDTPYQVAIDEAIELARKFGSAQSPQFVNGLLDKLVTADRKSDR
ncbi:transcription antitermination factor NusB [Thalassoroseus pseudoceratinae]|uniref:transcription antitermination factor NusB n=1 Tax=Thalassoroseus pseudoceratinae TaxID=2713176 RepID=UPI00142411F1|nr:transcription antitermination factor NusB [Thalassoroseus pseudoceratinae]